jgi:hypothetical protein
LKRDGNSVVGGDQDKGWLLKNARDIRESKLQNVAIGEMSSVRRGKIFEV